MFEYGSGPGRDGYWNSEKFNSQVDEFLDAFDVLYPDRQLMLEVDHSSGHLKAKANGLDVNQMGYKWGGAKAALADMVIIDGCLGDAPPVYHNGQALAIGDTQFFVFQAGDPPPFECPDASPIDVEETNVDLIALEQGKRARAIIAANVKALAKGLDKKDKQKNEKQTDKRRGGAIFKATVQTLCKDQAVLPLVRVWRYQRRARDYHRVYLDLHDKTTTHSMLEDMRKTYSTHRNIGEIERAFIERAPTTPMYG
jgi:hypothetical protein